MREKEPQIAASAPQAPLRTEMLHLRCTETQMKRLQRKAVIQHRTLSSYLLLAALHREQPITDEQLIQLRTTLVEYGQQLNDCVRLMHTYCAADDGGWDTIMEVYGDIRRSIRELFSWVDEPVPYVRFVPEQPPWGTRYLETKIRCTPREKERIQGRAARRHISVTDYLLTAGLKRVDRSQRVIWSQTFFQVNIIGNNLLQAVKWMNEYRSMTDEYTPIYEDYLVNVKGLFDRAYNADLPEDIWLR